MRLLISFLIVLFSISSCKKLKSTNEIKEKLSLIENWSLVEYHEQTIDTSNFHILDSPAIYSKLKRKLSDSCLSPQVYFYPIQMKNIVDKKLNRYLMIRSSLIPPAPRRYINNEYFILIWNMEKGFLDVECCDCENLEKQLKTKLNMRPTFADSLIQVIQNK